MGILRDTQDTPPHYRWLFGFDGLSLRRVLIKCMTPNRIRGGIWQGGGAPAADATGNVYLATGNGVFDGHLGGSDYGSSVIKMNAISGMFVNMYFAPSNFQALTDLDQDVGSGGAILLPDERFVVAGGKDGRLFLMSTADLGGFSPTKDRLVQEWSSGAAHFGDPVFFNDTLYTWGRASVLQAYHYNGSGFDGSGGVARSMSGPDTIPSAYNNEPAMSISSNGITPGAGILWATWSLGGADGGSYQGILTACDASNLHRLWS